jgi:hypothetical protein
MRKFHSIAALCGDGLRAELKALIDRLAVDPRSPPKCTPRLHPMCIALRASIHFGRSDMSSKATFAENVRS